MSEVKLPRPLSFHAYIQGRRYGSGRGSREAWQFVIQALGDPNLPDAERWDELHDYLQRHGEDENMIRAARSVWSSYTSQLARLRATRQGLVRPLLTTGSHQPSNGFSV